MAIYAINHDDDDDDVTEFNCRLFFGPEKCMAVNPVWTITWSPYKKVI